MAGSQADEYFNEWKEREAIAEAMVPLIGKLYRDHEVICTVFKRSLVNKSTIDILKAHRFARQIIDREIWVKDSFPILQALCEMDLAPGRVDLAKLVMGYQEKGGELSTFLREQLKDLNTGKSNQLNKPQDVVLYGFGRIGRLVARIMIEQARRWRQQAAPARYRRPQRE